MIHDLVEKQRVTYFATDFSYQYRKDALLKLKDWILTHEKVISEALYNDLKKSPFEAYTTEIGMVIKELNSTIKNLKRWMKNKKMKTSIDNFKSKSYVSPHSYGVTLIMSPWNYPFNLTMIPLIGAIAGGNTVIIKPSNYSKSTSLLLAEAINSLFDESYIHVILGGREENKALLEEHFDYIFFTGSVDVGKLVMEKASHYLTPVTLELGGKSPVIVDETADIAITAKRLTFGKFLNCGQTCIAPDYVYCHIDKVDELISEVKKNIMLMYGADSFSSPDYGKIVNEKHLLRLKELIDPRKVVFGGKVKEETNQLSPTIMKDVSWEDAVMTMEIFGPILPILPYQNINQVVEEILKHPKPLAFYIFSKNKKQIQFLLDKINFGGGCINDTIMHIDSEMPFGGVNQSGIGKYHGYDSFKTFTNLRSVLDKSTKIDLSFRYAPYSEKKLKTIKRLVK